MPPNGPNPLAFFSLVPMNDRAETILKLSANAHLVSIFADSESHRFRYGLDIGPHIGSKSRYTLATIGRCGDVVAEGKEISRIHCSFELHEDNKTEVMLQDRSSNKSTKFFGETVMPFEPGRAHRRVVVDKNVNLEFGFGGVACDLYRFRIVWHQRNELAAEMNFDYREDNPRQARTILEVPKTIAPTRPVTRIHTPCSLEMIRYSKREKLGSGAFGEVWKVVNVDTGEYLAVKRVKRPALLSPDYALLKREVETLSRISHRNIIEYRAAQWGDEHFDIVMELKPGNVEDLIRDNLFIREPTSANPFLHQMLQALDYLASKNIIHRDIKPENILHTPIPDGGYLYQLADFGLANIVADARTFAGSRMYMAPELDTIPPPPQTPKMDVWSLFVTLTYAMNIAGFRGKRLQTTPLRIKAIQEAAQEEIFGPLRDMAITDPSQRATAAGMLDTLFAGVGRTSPRNLIPPGAAISSNKAGLLQPEQWIKQRKDTAEKRPEMVTRSTRKRPRLADRSTGKHLLSPVAQIAAYKRTRQRGLLGALTVGQKQPEETLD